MCSLKKFIVLFLVISSTTMACSQTTYDEKLKSLYKNTVPIIESEQLEELTGGKDLVILDIRSKEEYEVSHIPGAIFIDFDSFNDDDVAAISNSSKVVVYCSVGYRSERIGEKMLELGFENVYNLYGGIFQWKNEGREIVNNHQTATDSVHTYNKKWSQWLQNGIKVY